MWCQIVVYYNNKYSNKIKVRVDAMTLLHSITKSIRLISKRSFFLFEMRMTRPLTFVAFEIKNKSLVILGEMFAKFLNFMNKGEKIDRIQFRKNTKDWMNGEHFLNTMCAHCNSLADSYSAFLMQQPARKKGLRSIHHLVHCLMNATFGIKEIEVKLYNDMAKWYGISKRKK